jgi:hypothetical protein
LDSRSASCFTAHKNKNIKIKQKKIINTYYHVYSRGGRRMTGGGVAGSYFCPYWLRTRGDQRGEHCRHCSYFQQYWDKLTVELQTLFKRENAAYPFFK